MMTYVGMSAHSSNYFFDIFSGRGVKLERDSKLIWRRELALCVIWIGRVVIYVRGVRHGSPRFAQNPFFV